MHGTPKLILFALAAACWLAAGPGGATLQGVLACRHHAMHQSHQGHGGAPAPADGPCFCDGMTGGSSLALSVAAPEPVPTSPAIALPEQVAISRSRFPLPPSTLFGPTPPPPIAFA